MSSCIQPGCTRESHAYGLCRTHYHRVWRRQRAAGAKCQRGTYTAVFPIIGTPLPLPRLKRLAILQLTDMLAADRVQLVGSTGWEWEVTRLPGGLALIARHDALATTSNPTATATVTRLIGAAA